MAPARTRTNPYQSNQWEAFVGNRAKRRAWAHHVLSDARLSDLDKQLAMQIAAMDRRGFTFCELDGEFFFQPKPQYAASLI